MVEQFQCPIRAAADRDLSAITQIYAHYVETSTATFELEPPDQEEMCARWSDVRSRNLPYLVAELNGEIAGYAYASPYRTRRAYRFTLESSIYVRPEYVRRRIGHQLLSELLDNCSRTECRELIAVIGDTENVASIRLHESFGFRHVGVLTAVGFKFDRWIDTVLMQRSLEPFAKAP